MAGKLRMSIVVCMLATIAGGWWNSACAQNRADTDATFRLMAAAPKSQAFASGPVNRTEFIAADATLNDVCGIGRTCWAVGERGVVLRSDNGGQSWDTGVLPQDASLRSVSFLTNQIGFVAGVVYDSFERTRRGLLLKTRDGGQSWFVPQSVDDGQGSGSTGSNVISVRQLPPVNMVRFFDLSHGVAIVSPDDPALGSNVLRTTDGGHTWTAVQTDSPWGRLCSGAFRSPRDGVVVGQGSAYGALVGNQVIALAQPDGTLRRVNAATLSTDGSGWIAGDNGLLLHSTSSGITWETPDSESLSRELGDIFDYEGVAASQGHVCVVGRPGSAVLYSGDHGRTWTLRALPTAAPLRSVRFAGPSLVLAVGAFGVVHRSDDSGLTWTTVRNAGHRAAVLSLTSDAHHIPFEMVTNIAGDQGFRTVVVQPSVQLTHDDTSVIGARAAEAIAAAGGSYFERDWMFARTQPLQGRVRDELLKSWNQQTDSRIGQLLPQRLAQVIRTWRPDVVCVDGQSEDDEVAKLWLQAMGAALAIAGGTDPRGQILDRMGLQRWTPVRVVSRVDGEATALRFSSADTLRTLGTNCGLIAESARRRLTGVQSAPTRPSTAVRVLSYEPHTTGADEKAPVHLLAGAMHARGTATRRDAESVTPEQRDLNQQYARTYQQQRAALQRIAQQSETRLGLIAHLPQIGRDLPPQLALRQLQNLATMYRSAENLDGEISVLREIISRFPDSAAATEAAEELFQFYSSSELRLIRQRSGQSEPNASGVQLAGRGSPRIAGLPSGALQQTESSGTGVSPAGFVVEPVIRQGAGTPLQLGASNGSEKHAVESRWNTNAQVALSILRNHAPNRASSSELLLRQAANHLRVDAYGKNRTALTQAAAGGGLYADFARAEMRAVHDVDQTPIPVVNVPRAPAKPLLDAALDEECWQQASEIHLRSHDDDPSRRSDCLIMLTWDEDCVYVAGRIEHPIGHENRMDHTSPRLHDAKHGVLDRVEFAFDTDRDYTTAFHFTIDEASRTSERCWRSRKWNPTWYVACDGDNRTWRFEAAIPQEELLSHPLRAGALWSITLRRLVPGVMQQSLSTEGEKPHRMSGIGLARFITNRR